MVHHRPRRDTREGSLASAIPDISDCVIQSSVVLPNASRRTLLDWSIPNIPNQSESI